jgi:predicted XRE-type DNA-binding protein
MIIWQERVVTGVARACELLPDKWQQHCRVWLLGLGMRPASMSHATRIRTVASHFGEMGKEDIRTRIMPLLNHYVQSFCGLYSRVANRLRVDRSYVSRVARGERHSEEVEQALSTEFARITDELR